MQTSFRNSLVLSALALGAAVVGSNAFAQGPRRQQASMALGDRHHSGNSVVGSGTGAPGPWSAQDGHVSVSLQTGQVNFDVRGLVLASGNSIGTPGTVAQVKEAPWSAIPTAVRPAKKIR